MTGITSFNSAYRISIDTCTAHAIKVEGDVVTFQRNPSGKVGQEQDLSFSLSNIRAGMEFGKMKGVTIYDTSGKPHHLTMYKLSTNNATRTMLASLISER